jgi:hypothetical protein
LSCLRSTRRSGRADGCAPSSCAWCDERTQHDEGMMPDTYDPNDPNTYPHHHHFGREALMNDANIFIKAMIFYRNAEYIYRKLAPVVKSFLEKDRK